MSTATTLSIDALIPLSALYADALQCALEPWGVREGADQGNPQTAGRILYTGHGIPLRQAICRLKFPALG